jgi:ubiquinone/menaquinone biosynthesis C-methylase UbiE
MDSLVALGLLEKKGTQYASLPWVDASLSRRSKEYLGEIFSPLEDGWKLWGDLEESLRSGKPRAKRNLFLDRAQETSHLLWGLHRDAERMAPELARKIRLQGRGTLLDLGGGTGTYALAFLRKYPRLKAVIYDLPPALEIARRVVRQSGLSKRVRFQEGNFLLDPIGPSHDAVLLSNVLHGNSVEQNQKLLEKVRSNLKPDGVLIVRDVLLSRDRTEPRWGAVFSVNLLLYTDRGRCYTREEVISWLHQAGFHLIKDLGASSSNRFDPNAVLVARTGSKPG